MALKAAEATEASPTPAISPDSSVDTFGEALSLSIRGFFLIETEQEGLGCVKKQRHLFRSGTNRDGTNPERG